MPLAGIVREKSLGDFILRFDDAISSFYEENKPNFSYHLLLKDARFLEYLYATLTAWGLNRFDGGPKLRDFEDFCEMLTNTKLVTLLNYCMCS